MLTTPRLCLRPFTVADVAKLYAMSQEDGIRRWMPDQVYTDVAHAEDVVRALIGFTERAPEPAVRPYVLAVVLVEHDEVIGHVGLSPARGSVEIGYAIEACMHGRGLATEAVAAMAAWALRELGLPEVLGVVGANNAGSRRVLEKAGFVLTPQPATRPTDLIYRRA